MTTDKAEAAETSVQFWHDRQLEDALHAVSLLRGLDRKVQQTVVACFLNDNEWERAVKIEKAVSGYRDRLLKQLTYVPQMPADHQD